MTAVLSALLALAGGGMLARSGYIRWQAYKQERPGFHVRADYWMLRGLAAKWFYSGGGLLALGVIAAVLL